jgi:hypothetical protein
VAEQKAAGGEPTAAKDTKPADAGKATSDKDGATKAETTPRGAPKSYELKAPEGFNLGDSELNALSSVARELDLSNEATQKIVDSMAPVLKQRGMDAAEAMIGNWQNETKADPIIGGAKLDETVRLAQKALELGPPGLRKVLGPLSEGGTGLGNQRDVLAFLAEVGRRVSPDAKVVSGGPASAPPRSAEERLADFYESSKR